MVEEAEDDEEEEVEPEEEEVEELLVEELEELVETGLEAREVPDAPFSRATSSSFAGLLCLPFRFGASAAAAVRLLNLINLGNLDHGLPAPCLASCRRRRRQPLGSPSLELWPWPASEHPPQMALWCKPHP